jgi:hypothetical protein
MSMEAFRSANIVTHRRTANIVLLFSFLSTILSNTTHAAQAQSVLLANPSNQAALPLNFERHTDDLNKMVQRRTIRALVLYSRTGLLR